MERLRGPALPYARAMLGRAHRARVGAPRRRGRLGAADGVARRTGRAPRARSPPTLDDAIAARAGRRPARDRRRPGGARRGARPPAPALGRLLVTRMPDYRANLVARALPDRRRGARPTCATTSARCAREYAPAQLWRLLLRYLFEYQYLRPALGLDRRRRSARVLLCAAPGSPTTSSPRASLDEAPLRRPRRVVAPAVRRPRDRSATAEAPVHMTVTRPSRLAYCGRAPRRDRPRARTRSTWSSPT